MQSSKTVVIRMLDERSKNFNKEIGNMKMEIENIKRTRHEEYNN